MKPTREQSNGLGWALVTPAVGVLLLMTIFPALYLLWASFRRFNLMTPDNAPFIGLEIYRNIATNGDIRYSMLVTILFVVAAVGIELALGLLLALMLAPKSRSNAAAATLLILPMAVTPVVSALVWRELFNPNYGWVNYYLRQIGIMHEPIAWLSNPQTSWFTVISLDVWQWTPFVALILMAGLQGIPPEPREAAAVDGAEGWRLFWDVTFPLLRPFVAIAVLLRTLEAFKTFGTIRVLTGGGPGISTEIINLTIYRTALQDFSVGAAASLGIAFLVFLSILVPQMLRILARNSDLVEAGGAKYSDSTHPRGAEPSRPLDLGAPGDGSSRLDGHDLDQTGRVCPDNPADLAVSADAATLRRRSAGSCCHPIRAVTAPQRDRGRWLNSVGAGARSVRGVRARATPFQRKTLSGVVDPLDHHVSARRGRDSGLHPGRAAAIDRSISDADRALCRLQSAARHLGPSQFDPANPRGDRRRRAGRRRLTHGDHQPYRAAPRRAGHRDGGDLEHASGMERVLVRAHLGAVAG